MAAIDTYDTDKPCEAVSEPHWDPSVKIIDTVSEVILVKHKLGFLTLIALDFDVCNSWAGVSPSMQVALLQGGPAALLYGLFITTSLYLSIAFSMAELAGVYLPLAASTISHMYFPPVDILEVVKML